MKRLTKGRGVDVILDPIGGASFGASYRMLAPLGRLVMLGISSMSGEKRSALARAALLVGDEAVRRRCR